MDVVFGLLLLLLLGISKGVKTYCDGRQDGAQCYGALGGTLVLKLMDSASEIYKYQWLNKTTVILNGRKNRIVNNQIENRSSFTHSDGVFRIYNLSQTDDGEYALEIFDSHGSKLVHQNQKLTIQAPVSSVQLVSECLSQGEMKVSCSSEGGDSPQYSWTLDGQTLTDTQLLSGNNETNNITLKQDTSGLLVCTVRNHISTISACGFIYTNCTLPNGKLVSPWVIIATNNLCIESTTTPNWIDTEGKRLVSRSLPATICCESSCGISCFNWDRLLFCLEDKEIQGSSVLPHH
ncbi:uncharacterized protein LOC117817984 isoform X2 [Notolabrus celidotus]|uniref:uncharacterized protein LOC117817984 isoform X2 n=1 Tax=Notolabrus celidotus TaxID=1203425 RepID=UPI0014906E6A|nr:uncharacterized protein LOC117817984 isoform X2 [Notolabrus celidotus]